MWLWSTNMSVWCRCSACRSIPVSHFKHVFCDGASFLSLVVCYYQCSDFIAVMELDSHHLSSVDLNNYFLCVQVPCGPGSSWQQDVGQWRLQFHRRPAGRSHLQHGWVTPPFPYERIFLCAPRGHCAGVIKGQLRLYTQPLFGFLWWIYSVIKPQPLLSDSVKSDLVF